MVDKEFENLTSEEKLQKAIEYMHDLGFGGLRISEKMEYVIAETLLNIAKSQERIAKAQERLAEAQERFVKLETVQMQKSYLNFDEFNTRVKECEYPTQEKTN